jgi:hypothetical protein
MNNEDLVTLFNIIIGVAITIGYLLIFLTLTFLLYKVIISKFDFHSEYVRFGVFVVSLIVMDRIINIFISSFIASDITKQLQQIEEVRQWLK